MGNFKNLGILFVALILSPLLAKAKSAEFISVSMDRANQLYVEGEQAHISITKRIVPGQPDYTVSVQAFFPDSGHEVLLSQVGQTLSFVTPRLTPGDQHFIANAYIQVAAKPPLRDGEKVLVQSVDTVVHVSPDVTPPILSIQSPTENQNINNQNVEVSGSSNERLSQVTFAIDDQASVLGVLSQDLKSFSGPVAAQTTGNHVVTIVATDMAGNATTAQIHVSQMFNVPPVASFTVDSSQDPTIHFDASSSVDPDGSIVSYEWDFGDGTTGSGPIVNHTYSTQANFLVTLTLKDNGNAIGTSAQGFSFQGPNQLPQANLSYKLDASTAPAVVTFDASASNDKDGSIVSYAWDFGDGVTDITSIPQTSHTYLAGGHIHASVTVTDDRHGASTFTTEIFINSLPNASFQMSASSGEYPVEIVFDGSASSDPDQDEITSYNWDFGDGNTQTTSEPIINYTYLDSGNFVVSLTVTDSNGGESLPTTQVVSVSEPPFNQDDIDNYPTDSTDTSPLAIYPENISENKFNPVGASPVFDIEGGNLLIDDSHPITVSLNDIDLQNTDFSIQGGKLIFSKPLQEGQNSISINTFDEDGNSLSYENNFWAGSRTMTISTTNFSGNSTTIQAMLFDNRSVFSDAVAVNGVVQFENVPAEKLILVASGSDNDFGIAFANETDLSTTIDAIPKAAPSAENDNFQNGTVGWNTVGGTTQVSQDEDNNNELIFSAPPVGGAYLLYSVAADENLPVHSLFFKTHLNSDNDRIAIVTRSRQGDVQWDVYSKSMINPEIGVDSAENSVSVSSKGSGDVVDTYIYLYASGDQENISKLKNRPHTAGRPTVSVKRVEWGALSIGPDSALRESNRLGRDYTANPCRVRVMGGFSVGAIAFKNTKGINEICANLTLKNEAGGGAMHINSVRLVISPIFGKTNVPSSTLASVDAESAVLTSLNNQLLTSNTATLSPMVFFNISSNFSQTLMVGEDRVQLKLAVGYSQTVNGVTKSFTTSRIMNERISSTKKIKANLTQAQKDYEIMSEGLNNDPTKLGRPFFDVLVSYESLRTQGDAGGINGDRFGLRDDEDDKTNGDQGADNWIRVNLFPTLQKILNSSAMRANDFRLRFNDISKMNGGEFNFVSGNTRDYHKAHNWGMSVDFASQHYSNAHLSTGTYPEKAAMDLLGFLRGVAGKYVRHGYATYSNVDVKDSNKFFNTIRNKCFYNRSVRDVIQPKDNHANHFHIDFLSSRHNDGTGTFDVTTDLGNYKIILKADPQNPLHITLKTDPVLTADEDISWKIHSDKLLDGPWFIDKDTQTKNHYIGDRRSPTVIFPSAGPYNIDFTVFRKGQGFLAQQHEDPSDGVYELCKQQNSIGFKILKRIDGSIVVPCDGAWGSLYKGKTAFIATTASVNIDESSGQRTLGAGTQVCGTSELNGTIETEGLVALNDVKINGNVSISGDKTGTLISGAKIEGNVSLSLIHEMVGDFWIHSDASSSTVFTSGYISVNSVAQNIYSSIYGSGEIYNSFFEGGGSSHVEGFKVVNSTVSLNFDNPVLYGSPQVINSKVYQSNLGGNAYIANSSFGGQAIDNARVINSPSTGGILSGYATLENMHQSLWFPLTGGSYINNVKFYVSPLSKTLSYSNGFCGNLITDDNGYTYIDIYSNFSGVPRRFGCLSHLSKGKSLQN